MNQSNIITSDRGLFSQVEVDVRPSEQACWNMAAHYHLLRV